MTGSTKYYLYEVTRTNETDSSTAPVSLGIPNLSPQWLPWVKSLHPYFEDELWFDVGDTKMVPLTEYLARGLAKRKWQIKLRGTGQPKNSFERSLIAVCEERDAEMEAVDKAVRSFTSPRGDYVRAGLVGRYRKLAEIGDDMERLKASGIVSEEVADTMKSIAARFSELKSDLEAKGWKFDADGTVWEPSTGGRRAQYPRGVVRAHYRQLALQYMGSASDRTVVERIQSDLAPIFGDLDYADVREAIKYERKREGHPTPPVPDSSD